MEKVIKNLLKAILLFSTLICLSSCKEKKIVEEKKAEPINFTFYSADVSENLSFDDTIAKEITARTGVTISFVPKVGSSTDDLSLMITNNSYPDLIFAKGDLSKLVEADALIPLDPFIKMYGDNIKKLYGDEIVKLRYSIDDPTIYTFGTYEIKNHTLETDGTIQLQNAVLREFQYPQIKTLEDLEDILLAYKKLHPVINNHNTIGLSLITDSWYWYLGLSNPGNYVIGYPDDGQWIVNQETMEATYKFLHPEMYRFYKWLNKIYHEGLLDPESFTQDLNLWKNKIENGYVLATSYPHWGIMELQSALEHNGLSSRTYAYLSITADEKYKDPALTDYGFSGGWGIGISKDCKNPEAAFKFLDWMCSEEAQILVNWGIEGVDYTYDENGVRRKNEGKLSSGIGTWTYPFPEAGNAYIDSTGNPIENNNKEEIIKNYTRAEKETLKAYGVEMWTDLFPSAEELSVPKHGQVWQYSLSPSMSTKVSQADEYVKQCLIKMIVGSEANFTSSWENMCSGLRQMGIEEVEHEITKMISEKMKLWN